MTRPVPDIHSGLSPEDEQKYLLDAFRTVVGYSVNLPPEKLVTVSANWGSVGTPFLLLFTARILGGFVGPPQTPIQLTF
jgi:hypothetical protein